MATILFKLTPNLYLRDPQATELGQKIIETSITLIDKTGFDDFTFKKLAAAIHSTEASIYRYFESKHRLLLYLIDWYWTWLDYKMDFGNQNITSPTQRLRNCLVLLILEKKTDMDVPFVDEQKLQRIVNAEFEKTYLRRQVDEDNKEGLFLPYKALCKKIGAIVKEINPSYRYPHSLISTVLLSASHQLYYAEHLPSLTDIKVESRKRHEILIEFLESLVLGAIDAK
jgi:AcrR family transcriptional regulator